MATSVERRRKRSASAERIKNAYNGANNVEVEVIEAVGAAKTDDTPKEMRVCAYCRVSTEEESQQSSYELQVQHYTQYINDHENWTLQGIYADEGISGTSVMHRKQFLLMIEECKAGNINLIVTKSISRFARNVLDCISYVRQLKLLNPPVGVFFEMEGINSLDPNSEMILTILSIVAQEESPTKVTRNALHRSGINSWRCTGRRHPAVARTRDCLREPHSVRTRLRPRTAVFSYSRTS